VVRKRTDYQEQKFPGTFVRRSESSRELSFLGVKVPTGKVHSEERKYRGAKVLIPANTSAPSLDTFKNRHDRFCGNQDVKYGYAAELTGAGSRSEFYTK